MIVASDNSLYREALRALSRHRIAAGVIDQSEPDERQGKKAGDRSCDDRVAQGLKQKPAGHASDLLDFGPTEQSTGPEDQDQDQDGERRDILIGRVRVARPKGFDQSQNKPAQQRARQ